MKMRCARLAACCDPAHVHVFSRGVRSSNPSGQARWEWYTSALVALWCRRIKTRSSILSLAVSSALRRAGFERVEEETRTVSWTWPGTAEEVWEQARAVATPFLPMFERVPPEKWDEINSEICRAISNYIVGDDIKFGAVVVLASGRKP